MPHQWLESSSGQVISTILKHDRKQNTYKIALLRAINDIVLMYPDAAQVAGHDVAVPLRLIAERWLAYYWPFVDPEDPILQGKPGAGQDMSFRDEMEDLRRDWAAEIGAPARPSDGFYLIQEARIPRRRAGYKEKFWGSYNRALKAIEKGIVQPIKYAGVGEYSVFSKPIPTRDLPDNVVRLPAISDDRERCVIVTAELWLTFLQLSLWVEALAIHEWCLYTERVAQPGEVTIERGAVYTLLTDRPDNRRPLTWERNEIDLLFMEGSVFTCPWSAEVLRKDAYELDHIVPLAVYPVNELWNLVPTDPQVNRSKSDQLPSPDLLTFARPHLLQTYGHYQVASGLHDYLQQEARGRFLRLARPDDATFAASLTDAVVDFVNQLGEARNLPRFG